MRDTLKSFAEIGGALVDAQDDGQPLETVIASGSGWDGFSDYFPPQVMGTVLGGITMTSSVGMAFGPVGGGWIFDNFGDYHWLYVSSALIGLAAAAMALVFPPAKRQQTGDMLAA